MLVILSGPSGVGKDTLINAWHEINPRVERVIAYTTRLPRPGERPDIDYHFVAKLDFEQMARDGAFLEHKLVHDHYYATPLTDMEAILEQGKIAVLKIDVQGALSVMELRPEATTIFILPPSWFELERRIRYRGADSFEVVQKRLENAKNELAMAGRYQYQVTNDDLGRAVEELEHIVEERAQV